MRTYGQVQKCHSHFKNAVGNQTFCLYQADGASPTETRLKENLFQTCLIASIYQ